MLVTIGLKSVAFYFALTASFWNELFTANHIKGWFSNLSKWCRCLGTYVFNKPRSYASLSCLLNNNRALFASVKLLQPIIKKHTQERSLFMMEKVLTTWVQWCVNHINFCYLCKGAQCNNWLIMQSFRENYNPWNEGDDCACAEANQQRQNSTRDYNICSLRCRG